MFISPYMKNNARMLRCSSTEAEKFFWSKVRRKQLGYKFVRQYVLLNKFIVDFVCLDKKLVVELDGGQHCESLDDKVRDSELTAAGYKILRFWNNELFQNWEGCYQRIMDSLAEES